MTTLYISYPIPTREQWFLDVTNDLRENHFLECGHEIPTDVKVSCGFPSKNARAGKNQAIGVCHPRSHSEDKINEIFINPSESDSVDVLDTLVHELIHAIDDCQNGHKKAFKDIAISVGLTGKMTSTIATPELEETLQDLVRRYGEYPHAKIDTSQRKKQTTRMLKVECLTCETTAYQSNKQLEENPIKCLHCDEILQHIPKD